MASKDLADSLKADFQAQIDKAEELKAALAQKIQSVDDLVIQAKAEGYDEGKASIQLPDASDPAAQYTQEQMSAAVDAGKAEVKAELQPVIDKAKSDLENSMQQAAQALADLESTKAELQAAKDALAKDEAKIAQAVQDLA